MVESLTFSSARRGVCALLTVGSLVVLGCGEGAEQIEHRRSSAEVLIEIDESRIPRMEWCPGRLMDTVARSGYTGRVMVQVHERWPPVTFDPAGIGSTSVVVQFANAMLQGGFVATVDELPEKHLWYAAFFHPRKSKVTDGAGLVGDSLLSTGLCGGSCYERDVRGGVPETEPTSPGQHFSVKIRLNFPYYTDPAAACP